MSSTDLESLVDQPEEPLLTEIPATVPVAPEVLTRQNLGRLQVARAGEQAFNFNMLVYGESGVGKTRLASSAAAVEVMCPVLMIDVEGGTFSIRDLYPNVDVVRVETWKDMQMVYDELYEGSTGYRTVILDSLTEIMKFSMYNIMQELFDDPRTADRDPDIPSVREWGKNIEQIRKMVRAFRDLHMNSLFTALVREDKNGKTGAIEKKPSLSGKLSGEVAGFLDLVLYYYVKPIPVQGQPGVTENKRLLLSMKTEDVIAKDRSDRLPPVMESPTMADILNYITANPNS